MSQFTQGVDLDAEEAAVSVGTGAIPMVEENVATGAVPVVEPGQHRPESPGA
jgi:hypothetical protein